MEQADPQPPLIPELCWKKYLSGHFHYLPMSMSNTDAFSSICQSREKIDYSPFSKILQMFKYSSYIKRHFVFPVASCTSNTNIDHHTQPSKSDSTEEITSVPGIQIKRKTVTDYQSVSVSEVEVKEWLEKETGFDRLHSMYQLGQDGLFVQEEARVMTKIWFRTVLMGFCVSMVTTTLSEAKAKRMKNLSATTAIQRDYGTQSLLPRTAWRHILTSTYKLSAWSGFIIYISQTMAAYRNKSSVWEYTISSAVGFGSMALTKGLKALATHTLLGVGFGFIGGHLILKLMTDSSNTQEMRHTRHIQQLLQDRRLTSNRATTSAV